MPATQAARISASSPSRNTAQTARAIIELFHFPPILMVLLACGLFAVIAADGSPPYGRIALYLLAILSSQMAIGVHNDYCDRSLDGAAKPHRAIPSGIVGSSLALQMTAALLAASVALAWPLGIDIVLLGVLGTSMGFVYNAYAKRTVLAWAPFWVALPTLVIASFAVVDAYRDGLLLIYLIGLPLVIPVYISDTLVDIESDRALHVRGLAVRLGPLWSRLLCWACLAVGYLVAFAFWPDGGSPGLLTVVSSALLLAAVASDRLHVPRVHWLGIMLAVVALAADWLLDFTK